MFDMNRPKKIANNDCDFAIDSGDYSQISGTPCLFLTPDGVQVPPFTLPYTSAVHLGAQHGGYSRHLASYTELTFGAYGFTQIVIAYREANGVPLINSGGQYWLDPNDHFQNFLPPPPSLSSGITVQQFDHPSQPLIPPETSVNDNFMDFFQFIPQSPGSIPVTLGTVSWTWGFQAQTNNASWTVTPGNLSTGDYQDSDVFPLWTGVLPNQNL